MGCHRFNYCKQPLEIGAPNNVGAFSIELPIVIWKRKFSVDWLLKGTIDTNFVNILDSTKI